MIEDEIRKILLPAIVDKKRRDLVFARIIALCKKDKEEAVKAERERICAKIKGMELSDEEIRKYYLGGRLTAVKDCLKAHLSKVVNTLEGREGE